jgi:hypothetical protein
MAPASKMRFRQAIQLGIFFIRRKIYRHIMPVSIWRLKIEQSFDLLAYLGPCIGCASRPELFLLVMLDLYFVIELNRPWPWKKFDSDSNPHVQPSPISCTRKQPLQRCLFSPKKFPPAFAIFVSISIHESQS